MIFNYSAGERQEVWQSRVLGSNWQAPTPSLSGWLGTGTAADLTPPLDLRLFSARGRPGREVTRGIAAWA